jgi:preprotein translocase subunit SecA
MEPPRPADAAKDHEQILMSFGNHSGKAMGSQLAPLPTGLDALSHLVHGFHARRGAVMQGLWATAEAAAAQEAELKSLGDAVFRDRLRALGERFRRRTATADAGLLPEALAALREAADRVCGLCPFPVQLVGVAALHRGCLAEMATGEGKTLVAAMAAVLAGWTRRPCHVVTVNDYLAARDAKWFEALFRVAGLSVGVVTGGMDGSARQEGHRADVTYTTSKELLADFLRDRIAVGTLTDAERLRLRGAERVTARSLGQTVVMRGLGAAIVDEADSILIDEAVTPLIISREQENEDLRSACVEARQLAETLQIGSDYEVDPKFRDVELTPAGRQRLAGAASRLPPLWRGTDRRQELVTQALHAREFHHRDRQYVVHEGKVVIVDEYTGRMMPQRTWRDGLHQAIEAREGLEITSPTETLARMSFQRFFRLFPHLSGMTGTAWEARHELWRVYRLAVVRIPTNRPVLRSVLPDRFFVSDQEKWSAVALEIQQLHAAGRPVLVGTRSIAASEELARRLGEVHLPHRLLNATRHQEEAAIIADAGKRGTVTISTNMAGRGTDIRLDPGVADLGGLAVIATERHESPRIDRQLFGRSGRQGDPGTAQAFVSWTDEILLRFLPVPVRTALRRAATRGNGLAKFAAVRHAQNRAQIQAAVQRRMVLRSDEWIDESLGFAGAGQN